MNAALLALGCCLLGAPAHPRLFADAGRFVALRDRIGDSHRDLWLVTRALADRLVQTGPPAYREQDGHSGDEQLWQREVGNALPYLALAWRLTGERRYLGGAQAWALASCGYRTWGLGRIDGMDLATGHQLLGLAVVYDWCYDDLDPAARTTLGDTLLRRGTAMYNAASAGQAWWHRAYLQNHLWVDTCGLAAAGLALAPERPETVAWAQLTLTKWRTTLAALADDGASHEGVGYWEYGLEYLLKFMDLARALLGADLYDTPWFRQTARYGLYLTLPRASWTRANCVVDLADCPRSHWYGPDYQLRALAHEYRDGHAQWLADTLARAKVCAAGADWLNLLWYDPTVQAVPPDDLPTLAAFDDLGLVSARSGWDGRESLVIFKCGPCLGRHAVEHFDYDPGSGHVHPDCGQVLVFAHGEWLLRDDGYRAKATRNHNTLTIDGRGQLGEGRLWFNGKEALAVKALPRVERATSTPELDTLVGDATAAYPAALGLRRFRRTLEWHKPNRLLIRDELAVDRPRRLELRFHPERPLTRQADGSWLATTKLGTFRMRLLTPDGVIVSGGEEPTDGRNLAERAPLWCLTLARTTAEWTNEVELSW